MRKFIFERSKTAKAFYCSRCGKNKKAKNIAYNAENKSDAICNGCYGLLLARGEILKGEK